MSEGGIADYYNGFESDDDIKQYVDEMRERLNNGEEIRNIAPEAYEFKG